MKCPADDETLVMTERQGIEIDYCPKCRGVWLDRGELDKIIERSSPTPSPTPPVQQPYPPPAQPYASTQSRRKDWDDDDDYKHGKKKKRGGFLSELFD